MRRMDVFFSADDRQKYLDLLSTLVGVHNVQYYEHYAVEGVDYESCVFKAQTCTVGSEETKQGQTDIRGENRNRGVGPRSQHCCE